MRVHAILLGASLPALVLAASVPTAAQTVPAAPADGADEAATVNDGDIIVTARRRNESLQTTPVAATVLSGTDLADKGVANVDALQFAAPSIVVNNFG